MPLCFDNTYARLHGRLYARVRPTPVAAPAWLAVNEALGEPLGLRPEELRSAALLEALAGNRLPDGADPIAQAYAGHQFGSFVPQLGDGRAVLLGEVVGADGARRDVQLKGAGPTPFSRGGDGRAGVGPVLREFLVSEAMHALGVPTTRALAAVATGEPVYRHRTHPGAVLTRVAASHLRVGTFQYFAARGDADALALLVDYALRRHFPDRPRGESAALALLDAAMQAQIELVSRWMALGFVHGVMNTDNCAISGETIDFGPCAFLDTYAANRTFSSIDHGGRYAYGNQPRMAMWNLARLAEALLPLLGGRDDAGAIAALEAQLAPFPARFERAWGEAMRAKLGLTEAQPEDLELARELLALMESGEVDFTLAFRRLVEEAAAIAAGPDEVGGERAEAEPLRRLFADRDAFDTWRARWRARFDADPGPAAAQAEQMRRHCPAFIPRNHRVEEALEAAERGDLGPFERLRRALSRPYDDQPELAELAVPPGVEQWSYRTFCGT